MSRNHKPTTTRHLRSPASFVASLSTQELEELHDAVASRRRPLECRDLNPFHCILCLPDKSHVLFDPTTTQVTTSHEAQMPSTTGETVSEGPVDQRPSDAMRRHDATMSPSTHRRRRDRTIANSTTTPLTPENTAGNATRIRSDYEIALLQFQLTDDEGEDEPQASGPRAHEDVAAYYLRLIQEIRVEAGINISGAPRTIIERTSTVIYEEQLRRAEDPRTRPRSRS